jgi:hypothetical protein
VWRINNKTLARLVKKLAPSSERVVLTSDDVFFAASAMQCKKVFPFSFFAAFWPWEKEWRSCIIHLFRGYFKRYNAKASHALTFERCPLVFIDREAYNFHMMYMENIGEENNPVFVLKSEFLSDFPRRTGLMTPMTDLDIMVELDSLGQQAGHGLMVRQAINSLSIANNPGTDVLPTKKVCKVRLNIGKNADIANQESCSISDSKCEVREKSHNSRNVESIINYPFDRLINNIVQMESDLQQLLDNLKPEYREQISKKLNILAMKVSNRNDAHVQTSSRDEYSRSTNATKTPQTKTNQPTNGFKTETFNSSRKKSYRKLVHPRKPAIPRLSHCRKSRNRLYIPCREQPTFRF